MLREGPVATETHEDFSEPILPGKGASDYERYLRTDELLALQKTPDERRTPTSSCSRPCTSPRSSGSSSGRRRSRGRRSTSARGRARRRASAASPRRALPAIHHAAARHARADVALGVPDRPRVLGHGSGFDSPGFREVRRVTPPLGEAFEPPLSQAGLDLVEVYVQGRDHEELYQLAEALIEWDERITMWRIRHYKVVARIIGDQVVGHAGDTGRGAREDDPPQLLPGALACAQPADRPRKGRGGVADGHGVAPRTRSPSSCRSSFASTRRTRRATRPLRPSSSGRISRTAARRSSCMRGFPSGRISSRASPAAATGRRFCSSRTPTSCSPTRPSGPPTRSAASCATARSGAAGRST